MKCFLLLQKLLTFTAKCIIGANNAIIPTFTAMQYPTVVRNFGVGMGNLAAGVALILVPYMWLLVRISKKHTHNHINSNSEFHMNVCYHFTFFPQTYFYCLRLFFFSRPLQEHIDPLLPMSIMGVCGIIGAIALTLMKDVHP